MRTDRFSSISTEDVVEQLTVDKSDMDRCRLIGPVDCGPLVRFNSCFMEARRVLDCGISSVGRLLL